MKKRAEELLKWSFLVHTLKSSRLVRIFLFFVATTGFLVGLKTKVINLESAIISNLDVKTIALCITLLLLSLFLWAIAEIIQLMETPPALKNTHNISDFIDSKRKICVNNGHLEKAYDAYFIEWEDLNKAKPPSRYAIAFLIIFSVFLALLSQILIISSALAYLL